MLPHIGARQRVRDLRCAPTPAVPKFHDGPGLPEVPSKDEHLASEGLVDDARQASSEVLVDCIPFTKGLNTECQNNSRYRWAAWRSNDVNCAQKE